MFLVKYNSAGVRQWTRMDGSNAHDSGFGVAVSANGQDVYITGFAGSSLNNEPFSGGDLDFYNFFFFSVATNDCFILLFGRR